MNTAPAPSATAAPAARASWAVASDEPVAARVPFAVFTGTLEPEPCGVTPEPAAGAVVLGSGDGLVTGLAAAALMSNSLTAASGVRPQEPSSLK